MFDPLNAARTQWGDIPPDDQDAFRAIAMDGCMVQLFSMLIKHWVDMESAPSYLGGTIYRICPRAMALREILHLSALCYDLPEAQRIARMAMK